MSTVANVIAHNNGSKIMLSIDSHGLKTETVIFIDAAVVDTKGKPMHDFLLGTDLDLRNKVVTIITIALKVPDTVTISNVDFKLSGAQEILTNGPTSSTQLFKSITPTVVHTMTYIF